MAPRNKAKSLTEDKKTAKVRAMLETHGRQVNFVNCDSLEQIASMLCVAATSALVFGLPLAAGR